MQELEVFLRLYELALEILHDIALLVIEHSDATFINFIRANCQLTVTRLSTSATDTRPRWMVL